MLLTILFYLFIVIGIINIVHFAAFLIGANLYDARLSSKLFYYRQHRRPRYHNPLISILIPAYNEELSIERCLDSIRHSTYKKVQIIVNNDASIDKTAPIVRAYIKRFPKLNLRLVNRRHNAGKAAGLNYIGRRYAAGELIMTLDADSALHKNALKNVVKYFDDPKVAGVAANVRIMEDISVMGVLQRFEHMIAYRSKKLYTVLNCELIIGGVASTYRRAVMRKVNFYDTDTLTEDIGLSVKIAAQGNKENRLVYASDVVAMTEGVRTLGALLRQRYRWKFGNLQNLIKYRSVMFALSKKYSKSLSWYRLPMAYLGEVILLLEPLILGYVLYLSVRYLSPSLILSAYTILTLYLLLVIWPDEHMNTSGKLKTTLLTPFMYFLFYIMNFVQLVSILRCLKNGKKLVSLSSGTNTWTPAQRSGKLASVT